MMKAVCEFIKTSSSIGISSAPSLPTAASVSFRFTNIILIFDVSEEEDDSPTGDEMNPHFDNNHDDGDETPARIVDSLANGNDEAREIGSKMKPMVGRRTCFRNKKWRIE